MPILMSTILLFHVWQSLWFPTESLKVKSFYE